MGRGVRGLESKWMCILVVKKLKWKYHQKRNSGFFFIDPPMHLRSDVVQDNQWYAVKTYISSRDIESETIMC